MTRFATLSRRVSRAEGSDGSGGRVPCVVRVGAGELIASALAAFAAAYPDRPLRHRVLVVPAKVSGIGEREAFAAKFKAQQARLVAEAQSEVRTITRDEAISSTAPKAALPIVTKQPEAPIARHTGASTFRASDRLSAAEVARAGGMPLNIIR